MPCPTFFITKLSLISADILYFCGKICRMKKTLLLFFILVSGMLQLATAQQFKNPVEYHNYILNEQLKVVNTIISFSNQFDSKDSILIANYNKTKAILKKSWENIQNLPLYNGDSELKDAALPLFEMYYNAMEVEYSEMVEMFIKKDFGKKTQERVNILLNSINEREKKLDARLKEAQANFAKKYDLKIEDNQIQKKVNSLRK
jgi:hypothetical protein